MPDGFVHGKLTDTVLGTIHLAVCPAPGTTASLRGAALGITLDVFNGDMYCDYALAGGGVSESTPCLQALSAAGVTIVKEVSGCSAATMRCFSALEQASYAFMPPHLPCAN